jgi:hypothetical protein
MSDLPLSHWDYQLKRCDNPACDRLTTAMYCCSPCDYARQHGYEIHTEGVLAHSPGCDERHADRAARQVKAAR